MLCIQSFEVNDIDMTNLYLIVLDEESDGKAEEVCKWQMMEKRKKDENFMMNFWKMISTALDDTYIDCFY